MHPPGEAIPYSNNFAQKSVTVFRKPYQIKYPTYATFKIGQSGGGTNDATYELHAEIAADRQDFFARSEVYLCLDSAAWAKWNAAGALGNDIEIHRESDRSIRLLSSNAKLYGLTYNANESNAAALGIHFLADEGVTDSNNYALNLKQVRASDSQCVGGITIEFQKTAREDFDAWAGPDKTINPGQSVTLNAADVNEDAEYNWYSQAGELLHTGKDWTQTPSTSQAYRLEVITKADGYKDYDEVWVRIRDGHIQSASPNPTSNSITVQYSMENVGTAYLLLSGTANNTISSHSLDLSQSSKSIDMTSLAPGTYTLLLVCDGYVADSETVTKL